MPSKPEQPQGEGPQPNLYASIALWVAIALALAYLVAAWQPGGRTAQITYDRFVELVEGDRVAEVTLRGHEVEGELVEPTALGPRQLETRAFATRVPEFGGDDVMPMLREHQVVVHVEAPDRGGWAAVLVTILPWIFIIGLGFLIYRSVQRNMGGGMAGGQGPLGQFMRKSIKRAEVPDTRFSDVAGQENTKREVTELVDYMKDPGRFRRLGAQVPKGVLLLGSPGTGKTLLARALAGEAGVPFYTISGSEFIEVFVGVGASRVRNLFDEARKNAPAIIFIDELDAIGRKRGAGLGGGHDEREQTLNQILAQMDGFEPHEAVIVLAATNRPDVLDPALLRPGRFDRQVQVDMPDRKDRRQILEVHTREVPLDSDVDLERIAAGTPGFSGADLKNLVNEAAMLAGRENVEKVSMTHFEQSRDKVTMGTERHVGFKEEERRRLAVHESGHTVVGYYTPEADPVHKVSIIPRGRALGGTQQLPDEDRYTMPEDYLEARLTVLLGGRVAESTILGNVSSGADDDIKQATRMARAMVTRWGMSEEIGPMDLRQEHENPFLGEEMGQSRQFSEHSAEMVDREVQQILQNAEQRAQQIVDAHREGFERLVARLLDEETLLRDQIKECLEGGTATETPEGQSGAQA